MGGCSAPFCNNSSKKGYIMKVFPRCPKRRALWLKNVRRENWIPTDYSCLCEVHFSPEMWEKRADHKPKLKPNAVPTVFGFFLKEKLMRKDELLPVLTENNRVNDVHLPESKEFECNEPLDIPENESQVVNDVSEPSCITYTHDPSANEPNDEKQHYHENLEDTIRRQQLLIVRMRRKVKALRNTVQILKHRHNNDKYRKALSSVFTEDQIRALLTKKRCVRNWSNETLKRASNLKLLCGVNGYEMLIRQGIPLPSLRTLRRKKEHVNCYYDISN